MPVSELHIIICGIKYIRGMVMVAHLEQGKLLH